MNLVDLQPSVATVARLLEGLATDYKAISLELEQQDADFYSRELVTGLVDGAEKLQAVQRLGENVALVATGGKWPGKGRSAT